jgi:integrase
LFPTNYNPKGASREMLGPVTSRSIQSAFELALKASGIQKPASVHTLRHYGKLNVMGSVCDLTGKLAEISGKHFP